MGNTLATLAVVDSHTADERRNILEARQLREEYMGPRGFISSFNNEQVTSGQMRQGAHTVVGGTRVDNLPKLLGQARVGW